MSRVTRLTRGAALLALAGVVAGCEPDVKVFGTETPEEGALFQNYVAIGNSITAGYQSSGINDSTQRKSYARLFAQAVDTRFAYPQLAAPGCPPPVVNFITQSRGTGLTSTTCALRSDAGFTAILNNVAVPGATVLDPTSATTPASNLLTTLVLGGKTQVQRALDADPTFVSIWIGNNDVLATAIGGFPAGATPPQTFATRYDAMIAELTSAQPELEGALISVANVVNLPILFQVGVLLQSPQAKAAFEQASGRNPTSTNPFVAAPITILPNCQGANAATLVAFPLASQIAAFRASNGQSGHPPVISCGVTPAFPAPVGDAGILTPEEQAAVTTTIAAYNAHIQATAEELGWAYVDVNPTFSTLKSTGQIPPFPDLANPTRAFGKYISLDGVHPADAAHVLVANRMIEAVNTRYGTDIPQYPTP